MTPGPAPVPDEVLKVFSEPMEHHRTARFEALFSSLQPKLKKLFQTQEHVFMHASTGSGAMESAIINTLSPGDEVLSVEIGKFGERMTEICNKNCIKVTAIKVTWGEAVDPLVIQAELDKNPQIKAVLLQACETSTATLNPVKEIGDIVAKTNAIFIVDAITALGAMPMPMDEYKIDVLIAGSQKALMLPTGLSLLSLSKKAWAYNEKSLCSKYYLCLKGELKANKNGETRFSTNVPYVKGLNLVLDLFEKNGMDHYFNRVLTLKNATAVALKELGLESFSKKQSPTVTAIKMPEGIDSQKVRKFMEEKYQVVVMGGQDAIKNLVIRIGHMGAIQDGDLVITIEALAEAINAQKFLYSKGKIKSVITEVEKALSNGEPYK